MSRLTTFATKVVSRGANCFEHSFARVTIRTKLAEANLIPILGFEASPAHGLMYDPAVLDLLVRKLCPDYKQ